MLPRFGRELFETVLMKDKENETTKIEVSFYEIYKEKVSWTYINIFTTSSLFRFVLKNKLTQQPRPRPIFMTSGNDWEQKQFLWPNA